MTWRAFVKSRSERRDLTKGERANRGTALPYPKENEKGGRGNKGTTSRGLRKPAR
jgi:hypothetical protein